MDTANNKGQILIEIGVVMFLIAIVAFAALHELGQGKQVYKKYQFSQEVSHGKKYSRPHKK